jgi:hypothetical protein
VRWSSDGGGFGFGFWRAQFDPNPDRGAAFLDAASLRLDNRGDIAARAGELERMGHVVEVDPPSAVESFRRPLLYFVWIIPSEI